MIFLVVLPIALLGVISLECFVRQKWIRICAVIFMLMAASIVCDSVGRRIGSTLVKIDYARYVNMLIFEIYQTSSRGDNTTLTAQILYLHEHLPKVIMDESQFGGMVDRFLQISSTQPSGVSPSNEIRAAY